MSAQSCTWTAPRNGTYPDIVANGIRKCVFPDCETLLLHPELRAIEEKEMYFEQADGKWRATDTIAGWLY